MSTRRSVTLVCVAIVLIALVLPIVTTEVWLVMTPLWLVFSAATTTLIRRVAVSCDEQPVSLLSLLTSRAPPALA